jgi:dolichol-phosphate mannosyltransferase
MLTVIVPAYNEGKIICSNLEKIDRVCKKYSIDYEIIVADDGSEDDTRKEAERALKKNRHIKVVGYTKNRGKGGVIKYAFQFSRGEYVAFIDADLDLEPREIFHLLKSMNDYDADIAIFSKYCKGSRTNFPLHRKILSKGYYMFAKMLLGLPVSDTQVGCKVFRREVLENVIPKLSTKKFAFDLELLAYANKIGYTLVEIPARINFRRHRIRINFWDILRMFFDTLVIFYRVRLK